MAFEQKQPRINGYHVVENPPDIDPVQAVKYACLFLEYAEMHTLRFSMRNLVELGRARRFAMKVAEDMD